MIPLDIALIGGGLALIVIAVLATAFAWRGESSLLAMRDAPTLSVAEVAEQHRRAQHGAAVEVVGTVECDSPLQAPYSEQLCVAYDYVVTEESERHIARRGLRPPREIEHHSTDLQDRRVPRFYVHDASGRIAVDTAGAQFDLLETVMRYEEFVGLRGSEREIWREERALLLGHRVYVLGYIADDGGRPVLRCHPSNPARRLLVSHRDEQTFTAAVRRRAYGLYLAGGLSLGGAVALLVAAYLV